MPAWYDPLPHTVGHRCVFVSRLSVSLSLCARDYGVCMSLHFCVYHTCTQKCCSQTSLIADTNTHARTDAHTRTHTQVNPCSDASVVETKDMCAVMEKLPGVNVDNSLFDPTTQHEVSSETRTQTRLRIHTRTHTRARARCMHVCISYIVCV